MSEQDNGDEATLEAQEEVVLETTDESEEVDWKAEAEKAKKLADNYKIRAEKAEGKSKEKPKPVVQATTYTLEDQMALLKNDVAIEDIDTVREYANLKGISIAEAIKAPIIKSILSDNNEKRQTASAANVGPAKRSSSKVSDEALVQLAREGKMPESVEEIERLNRIRRGLK